MVGSGEVVVKSTIIIIKIASKQKKRNKKNLPRETRLFDVSRTLFSWPSGCGKTVGWQPVSRKSLVNEKKNLPGLVIRQAHLESCCYCH